MKWGALFKFDVYRSALILADGVAMGVAMTVAYVLVFNGDVPSPFRLQFLYFLGMALAATLSSFSFLGVYSRRIPQLTERDARWIVLGASAAEGLNFLAQNALSTAYWPFIIAFWSFAFVVRSGVGIYASYRSFFFPAWQLYVVPMLAALAGVALLRLQSLDFIVPEMSLPISRTIHALYFFMVTGAFLLIRWALHWAFKLYQRPQGHHPRAILIGADLELAMFSHLNEMSRGFRIVAVLDNDPLKWGMRVDDARVVGRISMLVQVAQEFTADTVLLLKDSLGLDEMRQVESHCREQGLRLVRLGSLQESLLRTDSLSTADLLERKEYRFLPSQSENYLQGKRIMVTGAGGSIGSELVRQILRCNPAQVILLGRGENSIFELERELQNAGLLELTQSVIVNIADRDGLQNVFSNTKPQVVFHAAAHKHVPLMEQNIREAVRNNVLGTKNVMELAGEYNVERVVMISTDKAVNPSSIMGATKGKAEQVVKLIAAQFLHTNYSIVRFGNVLGSRGSVVRLFLDQIRRGGPVTVTDPRMTRYFMTIPEAVSLVLATGTLGEGFGIYVLEMGKPYKILGLAEKMIRMCGLEPGRDIQIIFSGIRPGEKIDEILVDTGESLDATSNPQVKRLAGIAAPKAPLTLEEIPVRLANSDQELRKWLLNSNIE